MPSRVAPITSTDPANGAGRAHRYNPGSHEHERKWKSDGVTDMADANRETGTTLDVKYDAQGLVPAIVQDVDSGQILMVGWMNEAALRQTLETKKATFYSRSRNKMWVKGESSGNVQEVVEARVDCDQDVVLLRCRSHGPCCHVGYQSCFYRAIDADGKLTFADDKVYDPDAVYKK